MLSVHRRLRVGLRTPLVDLVLIDQQLRDLLLELSRVIARNRALLVHRVLMAHGEDPDTTRPLPRLVNLGQRRRSLQLFLLKL